MGSKTQELSNLRTDVSKVLGELGSYLVRNPQSPRVLKLFSDRLHHIVKRTDDPDLVFLDSYLTLLVEDLFFNVLTDVSALVAIEDRDTMIRDLGEVLKRLASALAEKDKRGTYKHFQEMAMIWNKRIPQLAKAEEEVFGTPPKVTGLPPVAEMLNELPAGGHCDFYLASGLRSSYHRDIDFITLSAKLAKEDNVSDYYVKVIDEIRNDTPIDRIAFCEKVYGPIGAITLAHSIVSKTGIDAIYVRFRRRSPFYQVKGELRDGETVVIVSDVATTGDGIVETAQIIKGNNSTVKVPYAIVLLDREQGARGRLETEGIELRAIFTRGTFDLPKEEPPPSTDEIVPLTGEAEKELQEALGKEAAELMSKSLVQL